MKYKIEYELSDIHFDFTVEGKDFLECKEKMNEGLAYRGLEMEKHKVTFKEINEISEKIKKEYGTVIKRLGNT